MNEYGTNSFELRELLFIPKKSLETRLKTLEEELKKRQEISDLFISTLLTKKLELNQLIHRLRYQPHDLDKELIQIESMIQKEELSNFHDRRYLTERKNKIQEDIEMNLVKFKLLEN